MYQKILVPLDGSSRAEKILPYVTTLAMLNHSAVLSLKVVLPVIISDGYKGILITESQEETNRKVDDALAYLAGIEGGFRESGIKTNRISIIGSVVNTIIDVARDENIDLIAMASHGRSGLSRVFYGSVAAGILHAIDRPLLLIRSGDIT